MIFVDGDYLIYETRSKASADELTSQFVAERCYLGLYPNTQIILPVIHKMPLMKKVNLPNFFKASLSKENPQHVAILKKHITDVSDDVLVRLLEINEAVRQNRPITKDLTHLARGDTAVINALDLRTVTAGFVPKGQNATIFQRTPESKLFIKIPSDTQIKSFFDDYTEAPVPVLFDVMDPYPSPLYRLPKIGEILNSSPQERPRIITRVVEGFRKSFPHVLTKPPKTYIDEFTEIPNEHVFGDSINTLLPIQPNEQEYYDTLVDFIYHHINIHNKVLHKDFTAEELKEQNNADFAAGILPTGLRLYLEKLLSAIITFQYFHTGIFSETQGLFDDEDEDGDNFVDDTVTDESGDAGVTKRYFRTTNENRIIQSDADVVLQDYLNISAQTLGCSVYAEAVVKLLRWGPRKHNLLVVGEDNPNSFDLTTMQSKTSTIDFSKLTPVGDNGRTYQVHGCVTMSVEREGLSKETVAVLLMNQQYSNPHNNKPEYVFYAISVQDFMEEYKNKEKIIGVDFVNGRFVVEEEARALSQYSISQVLTHRFIQTENTVETLINLGIRNAQSPAYAILNKDILVGHNVDINLPIEEAVLVIPEKNRLNALYEYWYKEFNESCVIIDSVDLQEILDAYQHAAPISGASRQDVAEYAYSSMFGDNPQNDDEEVLPDMKQAVYTGDISTLNFKHVTSNGKNVFAVAQTPSREFVYASLDEVTVKNMAEVEKPLQHTYTMLAIFANMYGASIPMKAYFASEQSFIKLIDAVIKSPGK